MSYAMTAKELSEAKRRSDPSRLEKEPQKALKDPIWRLCAGKLYKCLNKPGRKGLPAVEVPFIPSPEQLLVIWCIHVRGWKRLIIPKARQLGMSLVLCLMGLDLCLFTSGAKAALIDQTAPDAEKKLADKVVFAIERLPKSILNALDIKPLVEDVTIKSKKGPASVFEAGIKFRGGTLEWLHISEWGEIQTKNRLHSAEIRDGSLPAAEGGITIVETTWSGGLDGEPGKLVQEALDTPEDQKCPKSWRVMFFDWMSEPTYTQEHGYIDKASAKHFADCEAMGAKFTHGQKLWYAEIIRTKGLNKAKSQYPTFQHECWESVPEGSIYGDLIELSRAEGKIFDFPIPDTAVDTFWDFGHPINTVCWFAQITSSEIRVIGCDMDRDIELTDRFADYKAIGYAFGTHYLPWDTGEKQSSGKTQAQMFTADLRLAKLGGCVKIVPCTPTVWDGIGDLKKVWSRLVFHQTNTKEALAQLAQYRFIRESSTGIVKNVPVHNKYSHKGDSLRQLGQALNMPMVAYAPIKQEDTNYGFATKSAAFGEDEF
jgi:hypothetical protein